MSYLYELCIFGILQLSTEECVLVDLDLMTLVTVRLKLSLPTSLIPTMFSRYNSKSSLGDLVVHCVTHLHRKYLFLGLNRRPVFFEKNK